MQKIYSISELNHTIQGILSSGLGVIKAEGEISNLVKPASGHYYFSLKDSKAQIRCVMFKSSARYLSNLPKNGDKVNVRATPSIYPARGDLQLVVEHIEPAGLGELLLKLEKLKQKIRLKGWTETSTKKPLPLYPNNIAIITSSTGAALHDVLNVLQRRAPNVTKTIYPAIVQGSEAIDSICDALEKAQQNNTIDLIILVRGGGSIEDLWAFNDEQVLKTVHQCHTPVICGIGHETDNTLCDLVADAYAPTPSAAAEIASEHFPEVITKTRQLSVQLIKTMNNYLVEKNTSLRYQLAQLNAYHPLTAIQNLQQRCDYFMNRLQQTMLNQIDNKQKQVHLIQQKIYYLAPNIKISYYKKNTTEKHIKLTHILLQKLKNNQQRLHFLIQKLNALNPKATLKRGYSITTNPQGETIMDANKIKGDTLLKTICYIGELTSVVRSDVK